MRSADEWLDEYAKTHQNPINQRIHLIAVPVIFWSIVAIMATWPPMTLLLLMPALTFYFALGRRYGVLMVLITATCLMSAYLLILWNLPVRSIALGLFLLAWGAQFYGHHQEGRRPSFLNDLLFLLVGPLWTLKKIRVLN